VPSTDERINTSIWFDTSTVEALEAEADRLTDEKNIQVTGSDVIRIAIREYLQDDLDAQRPVDD